MTPNEPPALANLLTDLLPRALDGVADGSADEEQVDILVQHDDLRIERIVSTGQASPPGFWYDQEEQEWVLLLAGRAGLRFETEAEARQLRPGDQVLIPAHARHRVEWTAENEATIWLAIFYR